MPLVPDADVGADDFAAERCGRCSRVQRLAAVERDSQVGVDGTFSHLAGVGVDAAGQVYCQNERTVFVLTIHQRTGGKAGRAQAAMKAGAVERIHDSGKRRTGLKERIRLFADAMEEATGMQDMCAYLTTLFEIDALFLNQDRHLNNIALIRDRAGYKPCPIFDCGDSFLLDFALYSPEIESRAYLTKAQGLPFKSRFTQTVHTAQAMHGKQLSVSFEREDIAAILDKFLDHYPKQFHFLLKERIMTVLMEQQKKLF